MAIILRLDRVMADRKISLNELSEKVGISNVNLSNLKTGKVKAVRFSTLDAICSVLNCQPGDILKRSDGCRRLPALNVQPVYAGRAGYEKKTDRFFRQADLQAERQTAVCGERIQVLQYTFGLCICSSVFDLWSDESAGSGRGRRCIGISGNRVAGGSGQRTVQRK